MIAIKPIRCIAKNGLQVYVSYRIDGKMIYYDLFHADECDKKEFTPKLGTELFRLGGEKSDIAGYPIVSINRARLLMYFLKSYDSSSIYVWETRGVKLRCPIPELQDIV